MIRHLASTMRQYGVALICCALGGLGMLASSNAAAASCSDFDVKVSLLLQQNTMHGTLCLPDTGTTDTVIVMVPGATYNHVYWDFPYEPQIYSFRNAMNAAGYATATVDRLGTGASSKPVLAATLTAAAQAGAVHEVIQALRHASIGGHAFKRVVLAGHSLGSAITIAESATFHDVDGTIVTGLTHKINAATLTTFFATSAYPATLDPQLSSRGYIDPTYLTTRPNTRFQDFYSPGAADPGVLQTDEATKDVFATTEAADAVGVDVILPYSAGIASPVLIAIGGVDSFFCGALSADCSSATTVLAGERPYYSGSSCVQAYVLPGAGHDINLNPRTQEYQQAVRAWLDRLVKGQLQSC